MPLFCFCFFSHVKFAIKVSLPSSLFCFSVTIRDTFRAVHISFFLFSQFYHFKLTPNEYFCFVFCLVHLLLLSFRCFFSLLNKHLNETQEKSFATIWRKTFFLLNAHCTECNIKLNIVHRRMVPSSLFHFSVNVFYCIHLTCCHSQGTLPPVKLIKKLQIILSYNLFNCLLIILWWTVCQVLERLRLLSCFHLAGTIACAWDLIKTQSEEANKVSGGRLLQLRLLTSPLWTNLWDSPWHASIHWLSLKL